VLSRHRGTQNYIILTDVPLTADARSNLCEVVVSCGFKGNFATVDGKEICQFLDMHGDIRKSYPQLLGLADLDVIVNRDLYARSQAYLEAWQPKLATYVQTEAHTKAMSLLKKKYFIVLDGPPEAGKTTIAAALALIHAADGYEIIDVRSSNDMFRAPDEKSGKGKQEKKKKRLFVADDAIGSISLVPAQADEWSRDLPGILRKLSGNRLLVWTARRYILEEALATSRLKDAVAEFPRPHEVLVEVGKLSTMQKAEIVYNHAKQANLSVEHRKLVREYAVQIVHHPNFSPLRIAELTSIILKSSLENANALTWEEVSHFLNNPGDRWIQAYRALSRSEQILLSTMLDFEGAILARVLRASYETRVGYREGGHLSFEECVTRLDHSFLTLTSSHSGDQYISVQHPSLRDMLLLHLRGDPDARMRYISLASPFGLARVIGGIAETFESETPPQHSVVPINEDEFQVFLDRLRVLSQGVLSLKDWDLLLTAAERLIPRKTEPPAGFTPAMLEFWKAIGEEPPAERLDPVDLDLEAFALHWKGQIIHALLDGFASRRTLENSQRLGADEWRRLLTRFYGLAAYISPPIYPSFTVDLCRNLSNDLDSIRLANVIHGVEPLVVKQRIARATLEEWRNEVEAEAKSLKRQGEGFGDGDDPNEFDEWGSKCKEFLDTAADFAQWGMAEQIDAIEELDDVRESAERPHEPEPEVAEDQPLPETGPYWTIQRLFEDL
jgi:adenylate kinase family enzyme